MPTDEWASSLIAMSGRSGAAACRRWAAVSRATISAERLPADPPETKQPPASLGKPARSASTPSAWFSATTTPAASSHEVPWRDEVETNMSKSREAFVGAAGMNDKNRGLSQETTAVASFSTKRFSTCAASLPPGRMSPESSWSSDSTRPPKSRETGSRDSRSRHAVTMRSVIASS